VDRFYQLVHDDAVIGPLFAQHIHHWHAHLQVMRDFWSTALLGSGRYRGNAFAAHMKLPLAEAHFEHWLRLWEQAAVETLPPALAERAIKRARHMTQSFRTGLLPWKQPDGSLGRDPAPG
jgi:hemoglobin